MIEELTKDQETKMDKLADALISNALSGDTSYDLAKIEKWIDFLYEGKPPKEIVICKSPTEVLDKYEEFGGKKDSIKEIDAIGIGFDSGWTGFYKFFQEECGVDFSDIPEFDKWKIVLDTGVWGCLLFEKVAFISLRPSLVRQNEKHNLHCDDGPAVQFSDGTSYYFWNGVRVSQKLIMKPQDITREDIMAEKNSEVSRAIAEKLGWDEYMKRCKVILIDKWFDADKSLHYELWDFKKRFDLTPRLLKMESPELKDGTRPYYIEPVDPGLKTCQAARRWQFMKSDCAWPSVDECNKSPELRFEVEA